MAKLIPVPVDVSVGTPSRDPATKDPRVYGNFSIVPYATPRYGCLEIDRWLVLDADGGNHELNDRLLFSVFPRKLLCKVCEETFEMENTSIPIVIIVDEESWTFQMRARELEYEIVHYEIEIDDTWFKLTEAYVGDILGDEQLLYADRAVLPSIDFADTEILINDMS